MQVEILEMITFYEKLGRSVVTCANVDECLIAKIGIIG